jgi:uncharacterized membrane protein YphA (DoxX/SURF4 family)
VTSASNTPGSIAAKLAAVVRPILVMPTVRWFACLGLCAAYIQGPVTKIMDFDSAIAEMNHFGLSSAPTFAVLVIAFELIASAMILFGGWRWLAALALAGFTLMATFVALRFWEMAAGQGRMMAMNAFFEHLGLIGGFVLVAIDDLTKSKETIYE